MPTGYTADVQSGKVTDFREFAWQCARAFGALILMRDDPTGAPIPQRFEPETKFYDRMIEDGKKARAELKDMSIEHAAKEAAAEHRDALAAWNSRRIERDAEKLRYLSMIEKVQAWQPPSPEHQGMKDFMLEQLNSSLKFDCTEYSGPPEPMTATAWLARKNEKAVRDISYGIENREREIERTESRNRWLAQLRDSLK